MRLSLFRVCVLAAVLATMMAGAARAMHAPAPPARVHAIRASVDHYRSVAWLFQRAAHQKTTPTTFSYRRSTDGDYLQWTLKQWQQREFDARRQALASLRRRLDLALPASPGIHASIASRLAYSETLTAKLQKIYPGRVATRGLASARRLPATKRLYQWQVKAAEATLTVSRHATHLTVIGPHWLTGSFLCIHRFEAAWDANTGNGYYGGLQMNDFFMRRYGAAYVSRWGTADRWPAWAQIAAAVRAYQSGRGFWPWPNTARACGLL